MRTSIKPEPSAAHPSHPARRSFGAAVIIVGITLLLARCSPTITAAGAPNGPQPAARGSAGSAAGPGTPEKLPAGKEGRPSEPPPLNPGSTPTTSGPKGSGAPPPTSPEREGRDGETTTAVPVPTEVDASFCRHLGTFVHPIRELHAADAVAGTIPSEIGDEVERIGAGFRDDPDFDHHGGAEDMLAIWKWAARTCTEKMAGQPPRFRLVQFEDQLAGLGAIDVCATLSNDEVQAGISDVADGKVTSSKPGTSTYSKSCTFKVAIGAAKPLEVTVTVNDQWGILDGSCSGRDGGHEITRPPAERACLVSSAMNGSWKLFLEQRSRTVSIELRWPVLDARPPSNDEGRQMVEKLYASIAPDVAPSTEAHR